MEPAGPSGGGGDGTRAGKPGLGLMQAWKGGDGMAALRQEVNKAAADKAAAQAAAAAARAAKRKGAPGGDTAARKGPPPLPFQIKEVLKILRDADGHPRSFQELSEQLPAYDFSEGGPLHTNLLGNQLVQAVDGGLAYKSEHGIKSKEDLLRHIRNQPSGVPSKRIRDAYRSVLEDADKLKGEGRGAGMRHEGAWEDAGKVQGEGGGIGLRQHERMQTCQK